MPSRCIFFFRARSAWSTLLLFTITCKGRVPSVSTAADRPRSAPPGIANKAQPATSKESLGELRGKKPKQDGDNEEQPPCLTPASVGLPVLRAAALRIRRPCAGGQKTAAP